MAFSYMSEGPRYRSLSEINANIAPKKRATTGVRKPRTDIRVTFRETAFEEQYEYICIDAPSWADAENMGEAQMPACIFPDHRYIMMQESWRLLQEQTRAATYCDPHNFNMFITNDHHGYAIMQLIEQLVSSRRYGYGYATKY